MLNEWRSQHSLRHDGSCAPSAPSALAQRAVKDALSWKAFALGVITAGLHLRRAQIEAGLPGPLVLGRNLDEFIEEAQRPDDDEALAELIADWCFNGFLAERAEAGDIESAKSAVEVFLSSMEGGA